MPEEVIAQDLRGEFRQIVNLFMRFPDLPGDVLQELMVIVFEMRKKYGGLITRLDFGDKGCNMLMLWGAPIAHGNDIGRALNFILELQSRVAFPVTAGVTYYIAHAGYLGSVMCEDYTCYGWGVNLASRFMMGAPLGQVWVDDRIARRVSQRFEMELVGIQPFKGFAALQKVHRVRGYKPTAEAIYQGELVGRENQLAQLANFTEPLWRERRFAGLLLVSGDAGIGKGRLVHEFRFSRTLKRTKHSGRFVSPIRSCVNHSIHCVVGYCDTLRFPRRKVRRNASVPSTQNWMRSSPPFRTRSWHESSTERGPFWAHSWTYIGRNRCTSSWIQKLATTTPSWR